MDTKKINRERTWEREKKETEMEEKKKEMKAEGDIEEE